MTAGRQGFTLVEVMVAVCLLSAVALAVTTTLVSAQRGRARSERSMQATQLAVAGIEQLRAGQTLETASVPPGFDRSASVVPWAGHPGLYRLEVSVSWNDGALHTFRLTTLGRR
jgi:prepilin-type N-terminal cleavage/methylation domain-containing protein